MAVADFIVELESDNSRLAKEAVIRTAVKRAVGGCAEAQTFLRCAQLAYDPYSTWGVKQVDEVSGQTETAANAWDSFFALLDDLKHRKLTGNAARTAIIKVSELFSDADWNLVCRRVLIKDLRAGVTATTLNKFVPPEFQVPGFGVQLATDSKGKPQNMAGPKQLEFKFDGVRMVAIFKDGVVTLMSRNGKPLANFPHIAKTIEQIAPKLAASFPNGFVLDGEVMGESFQALMKQAQRKSDVVTDGMVYNVFDIVELTAFETGEWNVTQQERTSILQSLRTILEADGTITVVDYQVVDLDTEEGHQATDDYFALALSRGLEGIMIKDLSAPYQTKRSVSWLKMKPALTVDLVVIGLQEGTGRNEGRLGALVCEGEDEGRLIRVNVGSGFSDTDRDEFWRDSDTVVDMVAEVQADSVTQNQDGTYSLRFPRFVRFRGFEAGEKM